ncbi:MAG TPA: M23 family metallopeptidase [Spirochaetota bacterium]|nr:M23 family metallopeptidase [Spirochaetota bacterium]HOL57892.1 M23 family metallopeptidase [Spirochaetota bacterium]HPP05376.1 M23 family metallopeptidase [Spirochaetota bacterium]
MDIINNYVNYFKNFIKNNHRFSLKILSLKKINYYIIYLIIVSILFIFFFLFFKIEVNSPYLKHRNLNGIKKYNKDSNFKDGIGGAYIPDTIQTPISTLDYTIQKGDSIHSIATKFGIDEITIINYNNIIDPLKIIRGSTIQIPNQDGIMVKIDKKNSLDKISEKYKIEKEEIIRINNLPEDKEINSGIVFVPGIHFDSVTKALMLGEYFKAPVYGRLTSYFGFRRDPWTKLRSFHQGVDIANFYGTKIRAAGSGKVIFAGEYWPLGLCVKIQHLNGYVTYYGHLSKITVKVNSYVQTGQVIGLMGSTGRSTGSHLHFEIRRNGIAINPLRMTVF